MKIKLLKYIDQFFGRLLVFILPAPIKKEIDHLQTVLLIRPGGIGDAVLLIPTIISLRSAFPTLQIDILAEKRNSQIFKLCPDVASVYCYDKLADFRRVLTSRYDLVIDTEQWHRLSAVVARLIRSRRKIGFGTNERAKMFNDAVAYAHSDYEASSFFKLLQPLQTKSSCDIIPPFLNIPDTVRSATEILDSHSGRYVVLFPGASIAERRWGKDKFAALAKQFIEKKMTVVIVGGQEDCAAGDTIAFLVPEVINLVGKTSLLETVSVLKDATLLVSGDSGVLHIGVGLGVPTVSLFGPGISEKWAPQGELHRVVNLQLSCSPCTRFGTTPACPIGAKCIRDISVDQVFSAAKELLL